MGKLEKERKCALTLDMHDFGLDKINKKKIIIYIFTQQKPLHFPHRYFYKAQHSFIVHTPCYTYHGQGIATFKLYLS